MSPFLLQANISPPNQPEDTEKLLVPSIFFSKCSIPAGKFQLTALIPNFLLMISQEVKAHESMSEAEDASEKMVTVERDLKRRCHEFAAALNHDRKEIKKAKLEVELLHPRPHLSIPKCTSPLLRLPKEIRDLVYLRVFFLVLPTEWNDGSMVIEVPTQVPRYGRKSCYPTALGLLAVNSQIYAEASEILYHHNIFYFQYSEDALVFFRTIGPKNCSMIRHLRPSVGPYDSPSCVNQRDLARALSSTAFNSIQTLGLRTSFFYEGSYDEIAVHLKILECLVDAVLRLFGQRKDQKFIPLLTLIGFRDGEEAKFPSSWNIVVKHSSPKASSSKITSPAA